jgi:hypothetical protein
VPNTRYDADPVHQKRTVNIGVTRIPPDEARQGGSPRFLRWVLYEYLWLTMHEELEWFRDRDTLRPVVDPHDAETTATRLLPPRPGESWWM